MRARLAALLCEKGDLEAVRAGCDLVVLPEFSLTGSVDPSRKPGDAITIDHPAVETLVSATRRHKLAVVFGLSERSAQQVFITQPVAHNGELVGMQRKRHLGEDEIGYSVGSKPLVFALGEHSVGIVIGAEAGVD